MIDDNHIADYTPSEIKDYILNIGYINENSLVKLIYKNEAKIYQLNTLMYSYIGLLIATAIFEALHYKRQKKLMCINEDVE
jgi:hypothetical protein